MDKKQIAKIEADIKEHEQQIKFHEDMIDRLKNRLWDK